MGPAKCWAVVACAALLLVSCSGGPGEQTGFSALERPRPAALQQPPASQSAVASATAPAGEWSLSRRASQGAKVTDADLDLVRRFVAFALEPTEETAQQVPFAMDGVRLGLGQELMHVVPPDAVVDPEAWMVREEHFRSYNGPFSPLSVIPEHADADDTDRPIRRGNDLQVSIGDYPHCAASPVPAPIRVETLRRVSVQPADESIMSCLAWFSVDLYLSPGGDIEAITLDLYAP